MAAHRAAPTTYLPITYPPTQPLARAAWPALRALRTRYQQHRDLFSGGELARLRLLRWLYQTGRLVP